MRIQTFNERRANCAAEADGFRIRRKREWKHGVPCDYDDKPRAQKGNGWKAHRLTQYR